MNLYLDLFLTFAKVGVCTFGGGMAMLPILQREVVEHKGWCDDNELADYFAIGQCTPGIIAVNTATFVGHKKKGALGGVVATAGVIFPSVVIILLIAAFLRSFAHIPAVGHAFAGIRAAVVALIAASVVRLGKTTVQGNAARAIFAGVLVLSLFSKKLAALFPQVAFLFGPVTYVLLAGLCGLLLSRRRRAEP